MLPLPPPLPLPLPAPDPVPPARLPPMSNPEPELAPELAPDPDPASMPERDGLTVLAEASDAGQSSSVGWYAVQPAKITSRSDQPRALSRRESKIGALIVRGYGRLGGGVARGDASVALINRVNCSNCSTHSHSQLGKARGETRLRMASLNYSARTRADECPGLVRHGIVMR